MVDFKITKAKKNGSQEAKRAKKDFGKGSLNTERLCKESIL